MPIDLTPISSSSTTLPKYLIVADADALAAQMPSNELKAYRAASTQDKDAALIGATADIDGQKWQGIKYDPTQTTEFPRVANGPISSRPPYPYGPLSNWPAYQSIGGEI